MKKIFINVAIVMALVVVVALLPGLNDRWQDRIHRSQDPEAGSLLNDARDLSLKLNGADLSLFHHNIGGSSRTIVQTCFGPFKDSSKCEPAKNRLKSVIDSWNQRIGNEPATTF